MDLNHYATMAKLFEYPSTSLPRNVEEVGDLLEARYPEATSALRVFYAELPKEDLNKLQELFTRSFDVQAITTLDIGYVLFGDDYKRGEILSHLNREHKSAGIDCGFELADYLPNVLRLMSKLADEELARELVDILIAPAIRQMIYEFEPTRVKEKNKLFKKHYKTLIETSENCAGIYVHPLKALFSVLNQDFEIKGGMIKNELNCDFLKSLDSEMNIEKVACE